jgi:ubiquinone/menaquinone biosynthesis C-methylase UbiE
MSSISTFWDFCAPVYDLVQTINGKTFAGVVQAVREFTPADANVLECAAGTGVISIALANKAKQILCTDMSEKMLNIAKRKAKRRGIGNVVFDKCSIYDIGEADNSFDVVIASQVLHLLDYPEKAAAELMRVSRKTVIMPVCLLKGLRGFSNLSVKIWRLFGFNPKNEFDADSYAKFLKDIGFDDFKMIIIQGRMPMAVAVWGKRN